jgi:hypothetical protein
MPDMSYENAIWRAKYGYKEEHHHDAPMRRNRDFKAMPYGTAAGMPNYRHAEPFSQLKNIKDFLNEEHHFPTKFFKIFCFGAAAGVMYGSVWTFIRPVSGFAAQKLFASVGEKEFSGRIGR